MASDGGVVDLYAGPGGWDEGMRCLGITDVTGIEIDEAACSTAEAAGHRRVRADVAATQAEKFAGAWGLVASPPCQAWSTAGKGNGVADRPQVHALIEQYAAGAEGPGGGWADARSHHAAQPVRWVRAVRPEWVCLEQVPPVLPLWRHIGAVLGRWGYSVWTGILNAADFGVPQTRERAVLIATALGTARPPAPTHAEDVAEGLFGPQLAPWVTMRDALGWHGTVRTGQDSVLGRGRRERYERDTDRPAPTLLGSASRWQVLDRPARTICGDRSPRWAYGQGARSYATGRTLDGVHRVGIAESAILQGFPPDYPWSGGKGKQFEQIANAVPPPVAAAIVAAAAGIHEPERSVTSGA